MLAFRGSYFWNMELAMDVNLAAPLPQWPPCRRLVAARRLGLNAVLAAPLPPTAPRGRLA
eukprot:366513-Pyramimonas_sp.AAC.2